MIKEIFFTFLRILFLFGFLYGLYWLGIKAILSFIVGMFIMAYLLLTNNALLYYFLDLFSKKDNTILIKKDKNERRKN